MESSRDSPFFLFMKTFFFHIIFLFFLLVVTQPVLSQENKKLTPENVERSLLQANGGVDILQYGLYNLSYIEKGKKAEVEILQKGSYNHLYSDGLMQSGELKIQQYGKNNSIENYGANSIMNNATIIQNGYDLKLIITNF